MWVHSFLTLTLSESERSVSRPSRFGPEKEPSVFTLGEGETSDPVEIPDMEPRGFGLPTRREVTVLTELFLLPNYIQPSH